MIFIWKSCLLAYNQAVRINIYGFYFHTFEHRGWEWCTTIHCNSADLEQYCKIYEYSDVYYACFFFIVYESKNVSYCSANKMCKIIHGILPFFIWDSLSQASCKQLNHQLLIILQAK